MIKSPKVKWQGVSLPVPFINDIKKHIKGRNEYRNVPAFVYDAVREKMDRESNTTFEVINPNLLTQSNRNKELERIMDATQVYIDRKFEELKKELKK